MSDYSLPLRRAVLPRLKHDAGVIALIPAPSIYGGVVPPSRTFPFSRYGTPGTTPFRLSGLNSSASRFSIHGYTGTVKAGSTYMDAEDRAWTYAAAFKQALDGAVLPIAGDMHATVLWLDTACLVDRDETDAWHAVVNFTAEVAG
jgi:hypothetical protein